MSLGLEEGEHREIPVLGSFEQRGRLGREILGEPVVFCVDEGSWLREAGKKKRMCVISHPLTKKMTLDKPFIRVTEKLLTF